MAFPVGNDGNNTLPTDANGQVYAGVFDSLSNVFRFFAGRLNRALFVATEKGTPVTTEVNASTSTQLLLAANTARIEALFYNNDTTNTVWVSCAVNATTHKHPIPAGTEYRDTSSTGAWNVICSAGTPLITVTEYS